MLLLALGFGYTMAWEDPMLGGNVTQDSNGYQVRYGVNAKEWPGFWTGARPSLADAAELYARDHWHKLSASSFPCQQLAHRVVDCGWNDGVRTAARLLQEAVNVASETGLSYMPLTPLVVDGVIGPVSLAAVVHVAPTLLLDLFENQWLAHIDSMIAADPEKAKDRRGWERRARGLVDE